MTPGVLRYACIQIEVSILYSIPLPVMCVKFDGVAAPSLRVFRLTRSAGGCVVLLIIHGCSVCIKTPPHRLWEMVNFIEQVYRAWKSLFTLGHDALTL